MHSVDQELLERWYAKEDAAAFREITSRYANLVFAAALRVLNNRSDAEDVAQECFETLAHRCDTAPEYLGSWLHTTATNRALTVLRSASRRRVREERAAEELPEVARSPWDEIYGYVDTAIAALPTEFRDAVVGHFLEGRSKAELARAFGVSRPTIHYRIDKGLEEVRGALRKRGIVASVSVMTTALAAERSIALSASLGTSLGKIAIAGLPVLNTTSGVSAPLVTTAVAGSILMKKMLLAGSAALLLALSAGIAIHRSQHGGTAGPDPVVGQASETEDEERTVGTDSSTATPDTGGASAKDTTSTLPLLTKGTPGLPAPDYSDEGLGDLEIGGRVVDRNGKSIGEVFVELEGSGARVHAVTDHEGRFRFHGLPPGTFEGRAYHESYAPYRLNDVKAGSRNLRIVMADAVAEDLIMGQVLDGRRREPVTQFTVTLQGGTAPSPGASGGGPLLEEKTILDNEGMFTLNRHSARTATIIIRADGYATSRSPIDLEGGDAGRLIQIPLSPGCVVEGMVIDGAGQPVAGASLFVGKVPLAELLQRESNLLYVPAPLPSLVAGISGPDGTFSISTFTGDEEALHAVHTGLGSGQAALHWGAAPRIRDITIVLDDYGAAEVTVTVGGQPAPKGTRVSVLLEQRQIRERGVGDDGRTIVADLPPRPCRYYRLSSGGPRKTTAAERSGGNCTGCDDARIDRLSPGRGGIKGFASDGRTTGNPRGDQPYRHQ